MTTLDMRKLTVRPQRSVARPANRSLLTYSRPYEIWAPLPDLPLHLIGGAQLTA